MISRSMTASCSPSAGTVSMWSASPELGDTRTDTVYSISILAFFWRPGPRTPSPGNPRLVSFDPEPVRFWFDPVRFRRGSRARATNRAWDSTRACSRSWRATRAQTVHCGSPAHPTVITTPVSGACACTRSLGRNGRDCWNWMVSRASVCVTCTVSCEGTASWRCIPSSPRRSAAGPPARRTGSGRPASRPTWMRLWTPRRGARCPRQFFTRGKNRTP